MIFTRGVARVVVGALSMSCKVHYYVRSRQESLTEATDTPRLELQSYILRVKIEDFINKSKGFVQKEELRFVVILDASPNSHVETFNSCA
jgi:hypothetical protein